MAAAASTAPKTKGSRDADGIDKRSLDDGFG
jgi:hypothetical protein